MKQTNSVADENQNILAVDDEPQIVRVLKLTLSSHGYVVRIASDGLDALRIMENWMPDLVITDLRMPNMDGLELCRRIRNESSIPILVLLAKGKETIKIEALDAGADDYVTKPFSVGELLARARASLRRSSTLRKPETPAVEIGDFHVDVQAHRFASGIARCGSHRRNSICCFIWRVTPIEL